MLSATLWRAFTTPVTYALLVILLGTAVMQIRYVNKALQRFDSTQVIPIQFVMFTLCVILGSAVLYRDFEKTTAQQAAKFVGGWLLTFFGVFLITSGRTQSHDEDDDILSDTEGVEETIGLASQDGVVASSGYPHGQDGPTPKSQSRRSSKLSQLSYAETIKTLTPQHDFYVPSVRILSPNGLHHSPGQEAPISNSAWPDVGGPSTPPGRGVRAYSTDSVPGGCAVASASTPATPMRDSNIPPVYPTDGSVVATRPGISPIKPGSHHRSTTFISPSPLSSTVTAVVKDAFLRAKDEPGLNTSSMRRIRSSIRASLFFNEDDDIPDQAQGVVPALEDNATNAFGEPEGAAADTDQVRRRSRSMSDTLGDFFGVRRKKRKDDYTILPSDLEAGGAAIHPNLENNDNQHEEH